MAYRCFLSTALLVYEVLMLPSRVSGGPASGSFSSTIQVNAVQSLYNYYFGSVCSSAGCSGNSGQTPLILPLPANSASRYLTFTNVVASVCWSTPSGCTSNADGFVGTCSVRQGSCGLSGISSCTYFHLAGGTYKFHCERPRSYI
jgi:hypothetical protein